MKGRDALEIGAAYVRARWRWRVLRGQRLTAFQERRGQRLVRAVAAAAPFYREHWAGCDLSDWRSLPTIDKALMMANFERLNTVGVRLDEAMAVALRAEQERDFAPTIAGHTVGLSSGTSGHRGLFLVSPEEQRAWAGTILARVLPHWPRRKLRVAFFLRANSNLYEQVGAGPIDFRYIDLMTPLAEAVVTLNRLQPQIVIGPPSLLGLLAGAKGLEIAPERLISVAEVLDPEDSERLGRRFCAPVHQIYQATEGLLAISCGHGRLHIQEDIIAMQLEPLADGYMAPIVTDLWRSAQPIIRYRLNDLIVRDNRHCPCGSDFRVLGRIAGRSDDLCRFPDPSGALRVVFPDTIRRMVLLASPAISDYEAVQPAPGELELWLEAASGADRSAIEAAVMASVARELARYGCQSERLVISWGIAERDPLAKRRRIRSVG